MSDGNETVHRYKALFHCVNFRASDYLPSCGARGAGDVAKELQRQWSEFGLKLELKPVHCLGRCHLGPAMRLVPGGRFLVGVAKADDVKRIVELIGLEDYETLEAEYGEETEVV